MSLWPNPKLPDGIRRLLRLPPSNARLARDVEDELRSHIELRVAELRALGMSESDAEAEALRRFGNPDDFRAAAARHADRQVRRQRRTDWAASWMQDARYAWRQFAKAPVFTAAAVLTLALGIGANTAIFTVVHRLLLSPLPFPNGNRIVMPMQENKDGVRRAADGALIRAWQERGKSIDKIAAAYDGQYSLRPDASVDSITHAFITSNFLEVLGVKPVLGRGFRPDEEGNGTRSAGLWLANSPVAMMSYRWWQTAYGGRPDALGTTVQINGKTYTVVGVAPPGLTIPVTINFKPDFWLPTSIRRGGSFGTPEVFATLRPGASADDASRELQTIAQSMPNVREPRPRLRAMRAQDFLEARQARTVQVLFVAVAALLLIACANVANLLLARASTRKREFAVRVALGASRGRLIRQVLTESMMLALVGGVLGIAVAWQTLKIIIALRPPSLEHLATIQLQPAVLLWSVGVSVATGLLFGAAPALFAGGRGRAAGDVLRNETRSAAGGTAAHRVRSTLIVGEIAMSLVLLVGAGLLVRSFVQQLRMPLGFDPRGLVFVNVLGGPMRPNDAIPPLRNAILARVRALPGVAEVAVGFMPGFAMGNGGLEADDGDRIKRLPAAGWSTVSPDYFRVARVAGIEGRLPDSSSVTPLGKGFDMTISREVVVSRTLARRLFSPGKAIGARLRAVPRDSSVLVGTQPWSTIVGVMDDAHLPGMGDDQTSMLYSLAPAEYTFIPMLVRTTIPGTPTAPTIYRAIAGVDAGLMLESPVTGESWVRETIAPTRFAMALLGAFAIVALVLSAVGLYAVIAYGVTQRTREIGIRVALGAEPRAVAGLVVGGGIKLAAVGIGIGVVVAATSTRALASLLYVSPSDPLTFAAITGLVASIALLASYLPARRAVRIDPTEALRAD